MKKITSQRKARKEIASRLFSEGITSYKEGKHEKAIDWFDYALELDPKYAEVMKCKGVTLYKLGKRDESIKWFEKTLKLNPKDVNIINDKGVPGAKTFLPYSYFVNDFVLGKMVP